jgi:class 3 adenylate cyclase/predicted ATPase
LTFDDLLAEVTVVLQRQGRVSYRALKRRYELSDEDIEDVKAELIDARHLATDEDGRVLVLRQSGANAEHRSALAETDSNTAVSDSAEAGRMSDEAQRRQITVMFCDLADSTSLSGRLDPEELRELIQAYQQLVSAAIQRFDGHVAQYLGDGVLVYFGYPSAHEDDAHRAVRAGLGILAGLEELNAKLERRYRVCVALRIGIHTGVVVVGDVGGGQRHERLALGETPNVAARLQGLAAPNTLLVSGWTRQLLHGAFDLEDLGAQQLKGRAEPMRAYRVQRESAVESRFEAATIGGLTPLVGRDAELSLLLKRWEDAKAGEGQVVVLIGEPGIGKSRLTDALRHAVAGESHTRLRYQCSPYYASSAFHPFIVQLERAAHFEADDASAQKLAKLEALLSQAVPSAHDVIPLFATMMSLPIDDRYRPLALSPERQRAKTIEALGDQLVGLARREPVFLTFEDAHWADPTSIDVLTHIVPRIADHRVLVVITCRPEFVPPWSIGAHITSLSLQRLSRAEATVLIGRVAGGTPLPRAIVAEIVAKTDGVPLYLEELAKSKLESGLVAGADASTSVSVAAAAIPATLQDALMARLDRLAPVREIAQIGAALGRDFSHEMLAAVARLPARELEAGLERLVGAELLVRHGDPPDALYRFRHALMRDAAYATLLRSQRHELHAQIAAAINEQVPAVATITPEILAHHYTEAGLVQEAMPYWLQAGQRSVARSAHVEAIAHCTKGLEVLKTLPDTPERAERDLALCLTLGTALVATRGYAAVEVEQVFSRARELCARVGDPLQRFRSVAGVFVYYEVRAVLRTAHELAQQLLTLAKDQRDAGFRLRADACAGQIFFLRGELRTARMIFERGIAVYDPRRHHPQTLGIWQDSGVTCLSFVALILALEGFLDQAKETSRRALALSEELSHPYSRTFALYFAAWLHALLLERPQARERAEAAVALAAEHGFAIFAAAGTVLRGWASATHDHAPEGLAELSRGLDVYRATGAEFLRPHQLALLAEACQHQGREQEGLTSLADALVLVGKTDERWWEAEVHRLEGELLWRQANPDAVKVELCFQEALAAARHQEAKSLELRATVSLSRLWQRLGRRAEAYDLLARIYGWFPEGCDTPDLQEAKALLDELAQGNRLRRS